MNRNKKGILVVVSGFSGAGKGTVPSHKNGRSKSGAVNGARYSPSASRTASSEFSPAGEVGRTKKFRRSASTVLKNFTDLFIGNQTFFSGEGGLRASTEHVTDRFKLILPHDGENVKRKGSRCC